MSKTLAEKIWADHVVRSAEGEPDLVYIDLHLIHEVTSAQAFDGLRLAGRIVRRPDLTIATEDHNTLPASTASNPSSSIKSMTTFLAAGSSPATGSAMRSGSPCGRAFSIMLTE